MERQGAILIPYRKSAGFIARKAQSARSWFDLGFPFTGWTVVGRLAKQTSRTSRISLPQALLPQKSVSLPYLHDSCTHLAQPPPPKVPVILFFLSFYYTLSVDLYLPFFFHLKRFVRLFSLLLSLSLSLPSSAALYEGNTGSREQKVLLLPGGYRCQILGTKSLLRMYVVIYNY